MTTLSCGGYLELGPPDILERKGSLTIRSHRMKYSKPVLVHSWQVDREGYPKDYDIEEFPLGSRNLCNSSYLRFGTMDAMIYLILREERLKTSERVEAWRQTQLFGIGLMPSSTFLRSHLCYFQKSPVENSDYLTHKLLDTMEPWKSETQEQMEQCCINKEFVERSSLPLLNIDTLDSGIVERDIGFPRRGFGALFPRHPPDHHKMEYMTNYREEYVPPYDYSHIIQPLPDFKLPIHRKCRSQITDIEGFKRGGIYSWQKESGIFPNANLKELLFPTVNPIPPILK
ncbi:cilia- and flagella-associated protein 95 isoform X1 [Macrotis lagotis]|uniref:cilia- and flagella-associated protein 95 isoform X1 n=1 Tax=Macrotis lagotis TaxID=92651 RepID=UPI003D6973B9